MESSETFDTDSIGEKILKGLEISFEKLVKEKAKSDEDLIFSENGEIVRVKAKDILKKFNYQ